MSEKHLTELLWKALATKQKLKDPGLGKALAELGKCDDTDPEHALKALAAVEKQAEALKKEFQKNEGVREHLAELLKEVDKRRKTFELLKKGGGKKGTDAEDETAESEDEEGGDLKSKLIGALKKVKQRQPDDPPMAAMVCRAKSGFAVLLAKKVGAAQKTQLQELFKGEPGLKYINGTCEFGQQDIYTFVLESLPSGAAKGLKAFLKDQTGITYKVQVKDVSGAVEADVAEPEGASPKAEPPKAPPPPPQDNTMAGFTKRFQGLMPQIKQAIAAGGPTAPEIKLKSAEAGAAANKKDFAKANSLLDDVEAALKKSGASSATGTGQAEAKKPAAVSEEFRKKWASAKQAWQTANDSVDEQVAKLQGALKKSNDEELQEIAEFGLNGVTGNLKVPLMAVLKDIDDANGETLPKHSARLRTIVTGFRKHITSNPKIEACDDNPFGVKMTIKQTIGGGLDKLEEVVSGAA